MQLFWSRLMLLPTGQVLFGPSTTDLRCYTPDGAPQEAWRPAVTQVSPHCGHAGIDYYLLHGTQLNGLSQANIYGDDCTPATNYPLVRLRSVRTGEVYYCRTYDFSSMAVSTGSKESTGLGGVWWPRNLSASRPGRAGVAGTVAAARVACASVLPGRRAAPRRSQLKGVPGGGAGVWSRFTADWRTRP
jgi:hypothetical protein